MFLNSYIDGISGGDTWALEVAKRLKNNIPEFNLVTPKRASIEWEKRGLTDINYILTTKEKKTDNLIKLYLKRIMNYFTLKVNSNKKDILFATSIFLPDVLPLLFLKGKKVAIFHMQAPHPLYGYKSLIRKTKKIELTTGNILNWVNEKVSMKLLKIMNASIFALPSTKNTVMKYGFSEKNIFLTNNGVDLEYIKKIPEDEKKFDACWVGRPHPQKGVEDLIDIWRKVVNIKPNATLVLMGKNTEIYKENILKNELDQNIIIKGYIKDEEKFKMIKKSRLFLSTSYFESFHIAVMEAVACGLTIIAYDLPVYQQIYGKILKYVEIGDKEKYANQIIYFLENDLEREKNSDVMKDFIVDFNWDKISKNVMNNLTKIQNKT
jgi:glycosyltransferase involved in cell wall biosynthesis